MITESQWVGPLVWACLYMSDNYWTIASARLYHAQSTIVFEGSYEITPLWQRDVNALRAFSLRFIAILAGSTAYIWFIARLSAAWEMRERYGCLFAVTQDLFILGGTLACAVLAGQPLSAGAAAPRLESLR
jgi:hypothetical protein